MPVVEQEMPTLPGHLISSPVFSGVRITRSLVLCVYFVDRCFSFCAFSFGHCLDCSSSIYGFWLPLWYLQSLLSSSVNQDIGLYALPLLPFCLHAIFFGNLVLVLIITKILITWFYATTKQSTKHSPSQPSNQTTIQSPN